MTTMTTDTPSGHLTTLTTLDAAAARDAARDAALARIRQIMLPAAAALAATRRPQDLLLEHEVDYTALAPFAGRVAGRVVLVWRDMPLKNAPPRSHTSVQVIIAGETPEQMSELARLAALETERLCREQEAVRAAQVAALDGERAVYDRVGAAPL